MADYHFYSLQRSIRASTDRQPFDGMLNEYQNAFFWASSLQMRFAKRLPPILKRSNRCQVGLPAGFTPCDDGMVWHGR
jgi:hypothetical protein